ncbi:MAG: DUF1036 domain-containing protein [Litorimonas sp.]
MRALLLSLSLVCWTQAAAAQLPSNTAGIVSDDANATTNNWDVCNETSYVLRFASAYIRSDRMQAAGWTSVQPGACVTIVTPKDSPRFLFAESLPIHRGGVREWKGPVELCATEADFTSDATDNCALKNMDTRDYFAVKPTERQTAFIEPGDFDVNAETAGLQRLLQDSGYKITRIDGLSGRRTLRTIAAAKSDLELDKAATNQELINALIPKAEAARNTIGLDICNDGTSRMYGAIAIQQDGNWTSRGWWPIDVGTCVKPYDRTLIGTQAHIYALQESVTEEGEPNPDRRLRSEVVTPAPFCIAESRFSALGRENCLEQGYAAVDFRPIPSDVDVQIIRLTDADFVEGGGDGLRR